MRFADITGNEEARRALVGMADSGKVAHAMLFYENEGCGALPLILAYYQYLNCHDRRDGDSCGECPSCRKISRLIHPDLHFVFPVNSGSKVSASEKPTSDSYLKYWRELVLADPYFLESELYSALGIEGKSGNIAVAEAKSILEKLSLTSVEDGYKAVVVWLPEKMNAETANKLLKVVEEPPENTIFLFVTHSPEKVLQTIFSRCQSLRVLPVSKDQVAGVLHGQFGFSQEQSAVLAGLSGGSIGQALHLSGDNEENTRFMDLFADMLGSVMKKDLLSALEASEMAAALESREKQKAFCTFASDCIRKIFMVRQGVASIAGIRGEEMSFFTDAAKVCGVDFCVKASTFIDNASSLIDRNVNAKIVFCDLVNRMFLSI